MKRFIPHFPIILIGLSFSSFNGCVFPEMDPPENRAIVRFLNTSDQEININMINHPLSGDGSLISINVVPNMEGGNNNFVYENNAIDSYFSIIQNSDTKIQIIANGNLVKEWTGPIDHYGIAVNSPFNYDSWMFEKIEPTGNNIVGKIIFTITNDDIGN
ncbi:MULTISPECIES: hypothetical protein [Flavobacteriaceae]|uniref:hypothetical protein n=1 Tax=Flavobacteriaceae TaxID=49546 RepID=UPI00234B1BCE|nr:hypothetical protein [Muricauda sp. SP22]MDC6362336.1 hypothetical protein [Muricauda sp. SP22]